MAVLIALLLMKRKEISAKPLRQNFWQPPPRLQRIGGKVNWIRSKYKGR